jgi:hypothetical protein
MPSGIMTFSFRSESNLISNELVAAYIKVIPPFYKAMFGNSGKESNQLTSNRHLRYYILFYKVFIKPYSSLNQLVKKIAKTKIYCYSIK